MQKNELEKSIYQMMKPMNNYNSFNLVLFNVKDFDYWNI